MVKNYSIESIMDLINRYINRGGNCVELIEGVLGFGVTMLYGNGIQ